jgi:hypothetical protein
MLEHYLRQFLKILIQLVGVSFIILALALPYLLFEAVVDLDYLQGLRHPTFITESLIYICTIIILYILFRISIRCFRYSKKFGIMPANLLVKKDKRPPVLYLRPFEFEEISTKETTVKLDATPFIPFSLALKLSSYEEILANILSRIGPCIAVGEPGFEQPILGFSRFHLQADEWQPVIKELMRSAALVVICTGMTPGVRWEFIQAAELVPRERLVILVISGTTDVWWQMADKVLRSTLPRISSYSNDILNGLIYFDRNKTPHFDTIVTSNENPVKRVLERAFKPVLEQLQ